jgi:hypothetical protein
MGCCPMPRLTIVRLLLSELVDLGSNDVGRGHVVPGGDQVERLLVLLNRLVTSAAGGQRLPEVVAALNVVGLDV